jgi:frataxin-like iron-binding protein CyaY
MVSDEPKSFNRFDTRMESSASVLMITSIKASERPVLSKQPRRKHLWFSSKFGLFASEEKSND